MCIRLDPITGLKDPNCYGVNRISPQSTAGGILSAIYFSCMNAGNTTKNTLNNVLVHFFKKYFSDSVINTICTHYFSFSVNQ